MSTETSAFSQPLEKPPHLFRFPKLFLVLGAVWPLLTIAFELLTRACAQSFFDPFPTGWHVLLALTVPSANALVWWIGNGPPTRYGRWVSAIRGAAWVCGAIYLVALGFLSFLALPMALFSAVMIVHEPLVALLPLATAGPLAGVLMLVRSAFALRQVRLVADDHADFFKSHRGARWAGILGAVIVWGAAEAPILVTAHLARAMTSSDSNRQLDTAAALRRAGNKEVLRAIRRDGTPAIPRFSPWGMIVEGYLLGMTRFRRAEPTEADSAREVFYRAYGETYDAHPPSGRRPGIIPIEAGMIGRNRVGTLGFAWDQDRGSDAIGPKIAGLTMHTSRMDWHVDEPSRLAYGEWTIEFKNRQSNAQEARCQMLLPPRGVVSRLTLWIDGEEREAAFGAKSQVKAAYRQVVQVERRDPVMVNMIGPDLVMTQCFPVPPAGIMKIRLGIIAPIGPETAGGLIMPCIVSRNFVIASGLAHAVWVQSSSSFKTSDGHQATPDSRGAASWQGSVAHEALSSFSIACPGMDRPPAVVWTEDSFAPPEAKFLVREWKPAPPGVDTGLLFVVDTSASMEPHREKIAAALDAAPARLVAVLVTDETRAGFRELSPRDASGLLRSRRFAGGMDGAPALHRACEIAASRPGNTTVLWWHGAQPLTFASTTPLLEQFLERSPHVPEIRSIQLVTGRDLLVEHLYQRANVSALRIAGSQGMMDPGKLWSTANPLPMATGSYSHRAAAPDSATATQVWPHLARYAAFEKVLAEFKGSQRSGDDLAAYAARYQIVTPVSSAVVLETQAQYDRAGLTPVDPSTTPKIPAVPEPGTAWLVLLSLAFATFVRRRPARG